MRLMGFPKTVVIRGREGRRRLLWAFCARGIVVLSGGSEIRNRCVNDERNNVKVGVDEEIVESLL